MQSKIYLVTILIAVATVWPSQAQTPAPKLPPLVRLAPPIAADKLEILEKLRHRDFAGLDAEFERYQEDFEKSPRAELNEKLAFDSFATDDPSVGDLIEEWTIAKPDSFASHMAMGSYFSWRGWHTRGPAPADETASEKFDKMQKYFSQSDGETKIALKIKPHLSIGYAVLLGEARAVHDQTLHAKLQQDALRQIPASFVIREEVMESMYPRWGGSHEMMADFAQQSQALVAQNPCTHWLLGFIESDTGETLGLDSQFDQSIAALTRAIQKGGDYSGFYFIRGTSYGQSGAYAEALEDFDRANELNPQDPGVLLRRATVFAHYGMPKEVLADLKIVSVFEAPDEFSTPLHDWAVKAGKDQQ
jgi:tetratricopeptide (TPR) repeat protein